tara:strand:+ start:10869 stop:11087 length:219 start_codon:yes stop_codon:yes gene_type:complete
MSEVSELREQVRTLKSQLKNQKRISKKLRDENKQLILAFKDSIRHIDEKLEGKSIEQIIQDLKEDTDEDNID